MVARAKWHPIFVHPCPKLTWNYMNTTTFSRESLPSLPLVRIVILKPCFITSQCLRLAMQPTVLYVFFGSSHQLTSGFQRSWRTKHRVPTEVGSTLRCSVHRMTWRHIPVDCLSAEPLRNRQGETNCYIRSVDSSLASGVLAHLRPHARTQAHTALCSSPVNRWSHQFSHR